MAYLVNPEVSVSRLDDGSWLATCVSLPVFVIAPTQEVLRERLAAAFRLHGAELSELDPQEALDYLEERGLQPQVIDGARLEEGTTRVPVLISGYDNLGRM